MSEVLAYLAAQGGAKFVSGCGVKKVVTSKAPVAATAQVSSLLSKPVFAHE